MSTNPAPAAYGRIDPLRIAALAALVAAAVLLVTAMEAGVVRADVEGTVALFGSLAFGAASIFLARIAALRALAALDMVSDPAKPGRDKMPMGTP